MSLVQTPFPRRISKIDPPLRVNFPSLVLFNGTGDPRDHIARYRDIMITFKISKDKQEAMLCKIFCMSFTGSIFSWFHSLQPGSIWSFNELVISFKA